MRARPWKRSDSVRVLIGILLLSFSAMMIFDRLPTPRTPAAKALLDALIEAGYFYPMLCGVYAAIGACLVFGRFVTLATLALAPLLILVPLACMLVIEWPSIRPLLRPRAGTSGDGG